MYRGVVQDAAYQTEYLQDYIRKNKLTQPVNRGRIWRLAHETTRRDRRPALSKETRGRPRRRTWPIRTAGGATPPSSSWCSAATAPSFPP